MSIGFGLCCCDGVDPDGPCGSGYLCAPDPNPKQFTSFINFNGQFEYDVSAPVTPSNTTGWKTVFKGTSQVYDVFGNGGGPAGFGLTNTSGGVSNNIISMASTQVSCDLIKNGGGAVECIESFFCQTAPSVGPNPPGTSVSGVPPIGVDIEHCITEEFSPIVNTFRGTGPNGIDYCYDTRMVKITMESSTGLSLVCEFESSFVGSLNALVLPGDVPPLPITSIFNNRNLCLRRWTFRSFFPQGLVTLPPQIPTTTGPTITCEPI